MPFLFYPFDLLHSMSTIFFSIISCTIAIETSRIIKIRKEKKKALLYSSLLLGTIFWLTHLFVSASLDIPYDNKKLAFYFLLNLVFMMIGSFIALASVQLKDTKPLYYLLSGILIGIVLFGANILGFYTLFYHHIEIKPLLLAMSALLIIATSYSTIRLFIQLTSDDTFKILLKWRILACIAAGLSFGGIPFVILVSIIDFGSLGASPSRSLQYLGPFLYMAGTNLLLMLSQDLVGEKVLLKTIHTYQSLFKHSPNAVLSLDLAGNITSLNEETVHLTGLPAEKMTGRPVSAFFENEAKEKFEQYMQHLRNGSVSKLETVLKNPDGQQKDIYITGSPIISNHTLLGSYMIVEDITEKKKNEKALHRLAYYDDWTGFLNRRAFYQLIAAESNAGSFAILLIEFTKVKTISDAFGFSFGNEVIKKVSEKLLSLEHILLPARFGGDEFAAISPFAAFNTTAKEILNVFKKPLVVNGNEITVTPTIGISLFPLHSTETEEAVKFADIAKSVARKEKKGYKIFDTKLYYALMENYKIENELQKAVMNHHLFVYYQPKYHSLFKVCTGAEALLRWKHPEEGFIPPNKFIPIAEESGLIYTIEKFVIQQVVENLCYWKKEGLKTRRISINVSQYTLKQKSFIPFVKELLQKYGVSGKLLELEITERMIMEDDANANQSLRCLRNMGIEISIDDFGTGYSSLSYLSRFNIDRLKIDQSFMKDSRENKNILNTIVNLAKNLDLKLIAEGVETNEQVILLQELGCFEIQGYYYSPAIPEKDFEKILRDEQPMKTW